MDLAQHVNCQLKDKRVIAPTPAERLIVMRLIFSLARGLKLLAAHVVDSHLHFLMLETRQQAMEFARRLESAIVQRLRLPVGFVPAHPEPVRNQAHLFRAFDYILRQQSKHGLNWDPFLDSSNVPDLLGMRLVGGFTREYVKRYLPRIGRTDLLRYYGIDTLEKSDGQLQLLVPATCAAAALDDLLGRRVEVHRAKIAAVAIGRLGYTTTELAETLGLRPRSVRDLAKQQADPDLVAAIRRQLGLREALAQLPARNTTVAA